MLQNLREHTQGWIAGVIAVVICLAFALWGIQYYLGTGSNNSVVGKVNGEEITVQQWNTAYKRLRNSLRLPVAQLDASVLKQLKQQALTQIITQTVLAQAAWKEGYRINNSEIVSIIQQVPVFQVQGQFSPELYQRLVTELFGNEAAFIRSVRQETLILQARSGIVDTDFPLANEVSAVAVLADQTRNFGFLIVPAQTFLASAKISDEMIKNYYNAHKQDFMTEEQIGLEYIQLSSDAVEKNITVTDAELEQYYKDNQQAFSSPQQWQLARIVIKYENKTQQSIKEKIEQINKQLQSNQDFAKVAMQYSDDKTTAFSGGVVGRPLSQNELPPELVSPIMQLQPGQISMPIPTKDGVYFIKILSINKPVPKPFAEVRAQVENSLRQQKSQQILADKSDQLANLTFTNPDTLKIAGDTLGLPLQSTALFSRNNPVGIAQNPKVLNAAFSDNVLKQRNNSDLISLDTNTLAVIRIGQYQPSRLKSLAEVRPQIQQRLTELAVQSQAVVEGEKILSALRQGTTLKQITSQSKFNWNAKTNIGRESTEVPTEILNKAFSLAPPTSPLKPTLAGEKLSNGDYAVIALSAVANPNPTAVDKTKQAAIASSLANQQGQFYYFLYSTKKMQEAKIKYEKSPSQPSGE